MKMTGIFFVLLVFTGCQKKENLVLKGRILADIDTISVYPGTVSRKFIDTTIFGSKLPVKEGGFIFKGTLLYPHMLNFFSPEKGISTPFFVEKGVVEVSVAFLESNRDVFINNGKSKSQIEYELLKARYLDTLNVSLFNSKTRDEALKVQRRIDSTLVAHIKENPNSYVGLWLILDRFSRTGFQYNKNFHEALEYFSVEIKDLLIYKELKKELISSKNFTFENREFSVVNFNGKKSSLMVNELNKKYVLLDFWFSNCQPCLIEMPKYIPIYKEFKDSGFEIVSISVDRKDDIQNWKRVIDEKKFYWKHYLDEKGKESSKINISMFPTTFLVDYNGNIIKKNISAEELNIFLTEKQLK